METKTKMMDEEFLKSCSRLILEKYKKRISEEGYNSSKVSDSGTDSSGSPPYKRPRGPLVFNSIEDLLKIDIENILVKDYVDWFMSSRPEDENDVILPLNYHEWYLTLGPEAKANVLKPFDYMLWYEPKAEPLVFPNWADRIEEYGELALEYFNKNNKCDYEYVRDVELNDCGYTTHVNFYGRLKVSPPTEAVERLFFAEVDMTFKVLKCCLLDSEEFGDASVLHPPDDTYCALCSGRGSE